MKSQILLIIGLQMISLAGYSSDIFVKHDASGANDGSSWSDAFIDLQVALDSAKAGDVVYVSKGTYTPHDSTATFSFVIPSQVSVLGGFAGNEDVHGAGVIESRDFNVNTTILSGMLPYNNEHSYQIVKFLETSSGTKLDGFTITKAKGGSEKGAGIHAHSSTVTLSNLKVTNNSSNTRGAGIAAVSGSNILADNIIVSENTTFQPGAGIYISSSTFKGDSIQVLNNASGTDGGGIYSATSSHLYLYNSLIIRNTGYEYGGGICKSGGSDSLINCIVAYNEAKYGAGLYRSSMGGSIKTVNTVVWKNTHPTTGEEQNILGNSIYHKNSMIGGSGGSVAWDSDYGIDEGGNLDVYPYFQSPGTDNFNLYDISELLGAGDPDYGPNIGVYQGAGLEFLSGLYVKHDAIGANNGSSWENAFTCLQDALAAVIESQDIYVAKGNYTPSDTNRSVSFCLKNRVCIFGGFSGEEPTIDSTVIANRDIIKNKTVLNGDLLGNDSATINKSDNSYHVVEASGVDSSAKLDGFFIMNGYADSFAGGAKDYDEGGGVYIKEADPLIQNCVFTSNYGYKSGCIYTYLSKSKFINNTFANNLSQASEFTSTLNCHTSDVEVINCIFWNNPYNNIRNYNGTLTISNSIVEYSGGSSNWDVDYVTDGGNNMDVSPGFADISISDFRLTENSSALNQGNSLYGQNIGAHQGVGIPMPKFNTSPTELIFEDTHLGYTSTTKALTITGSDLMGDATIKISDGFEMSFDSSDFENIPDSIVIAQFNKAIDTIIYIRFTPNHLKSYTSSFVISSAGFSNDTIWLKGNTVKPELSFDKNTLNFGDIIINESANEQSFSVEGNYIKHDIKIIVKEGYEISLISGDYSANKDTIELTPIDGELSSTQVFVRFSPTLASDYSGELVITSGNIQIASIMVNGAGINDKTSIAPSPENSIYIFPNPVNDLLDINIPYSNMEPKTVIQVLSIDGKTISDTKFISDKNIKLDVSDLKKGYYILLISNGNFQESYSFIKN